MSALTDRITEVLTGFHVDPSQSVCGCYELTHQDAADVAERIEAELQPDQLLKKLDGLAAKYEQSYLEGNARGVRHAMREVSAWSGAKS